MLLVSSCHSIEFMPDECPLGGNIFNDRTCDPRKSVDDYLSGDSTKISLVVAKYGHMADWDMSHVTNFVWLFLGKTFNTDISKWDTSRVTSLQQSTSPSTMYMYMMAGSKKTKQKYDIVMTKN